MGSNRRRARGKGTYKAAMRTVFLPVIRRVNVAPMAVMSFLRYSQASPVWFVTVISCEVVSIIVHTLGEVTNCKMVCTCREKISMGFFGMGKCKSWSNGRERIPEDWTWSTHPRVPVVFPFRKPC